MSDFLSPNSLRSEPLAATALTQWAYQTVQQSKSAFSIMHKLLSDRLWDLFDPNRATVVQPLSTDALAEIARRFDRILAIDWQEAEAGVYPASLLFDAPWAEFAQNYLKLWFDMPQVWSRRKQGLFQVLPTTEPTTRYPKYYLQNFHHQTDGYLSDHSADLYDLQVELLFSGAADAMRRRVLAPLKQGLAAAAIASPDSCRILDIACGTGRTLQMLRQALPEAALYGVDLSPAYLRKANQRLAALPGELPQLAQTNAEQLPYVDHYFHGLTCVFLFHELPAAARQAVINEAFRVLQPGGTLVICDSMQLDDSPELSAAMENFPAIFHEPYYRDYVRDDLSDRLRAAGFVVQPPVTHLFSKYWIAQRPLAE